MIPSYWLDLFTFETWNEFLAAGANVSGFREKRWKTVQGIKQCDLLLCYLTGVGRWIGILEVVGPAFKGNAPIWKVNDFPARVPVKLICKLDPLHAIPIVEMKDKLSIFHNLTSPYAWTGRLRGSPQKWNQKDGEAILAAVKDAELHPIERLFDPVKLKKMPPILKTAKGVSVIIPDDSDNEADEGDLLSKLIADPPAVTDEAEGTTHNEIQWSLLKLGSDMGLDVWVAKNDKGKSYKGQLFSSIKHVKDTLPLQFDEATTRTIQLIDVLWLKGNSIQAAFEIESTTSIFSGLLRMSDLITMQPNLKIPLYIVAPSERRNKVITEINRPTFRRSPPMSEICRFISFEELRKQLEGAVKLVKFLKPEFLESFSESCAIEIA